MTIAAPTPYLAERDAHKRDEIAARQFRALREHYTGKLWLVDIKASRRCSS
jgi:hypothetical protein